MGLRIKNLKSLKNLFFLGGEGWSRKPNIWGGGNCLKRGEGLGQFPDLGGAWQKRWGGVFEGGGKYDN